MEKDKLINTTYRSFVVDHILNPYGNMIGFDLKIGSYSSGDYYLIVQHAEENPKWWKRVTDRIVTIFDGIEVSVFPDDRTANFIKDALVEKGIQLIGWGGYPPTDREI